MAEEADLTQKFVEDNPALQFVLDAMSAGIIIANPKGEFVMWNEAGREITGIGSTDTTKDEWSDVYGLFYPDKVTPFKTEEIPLVRAISGERPRNVEVFVRNADKPEGVLLSVNGDPLFNKDGQCIGGIIIMTDVTDNKALERDLEQQRSIALQSAKMASLGKMAGGLAHEINNPLAIIKGAAFNLRRILNKQDYDRALKIADTIQATVDRISNITNGLLKFSRREQNYRREVISISSVIEDVLAISEERMKNKYVSVEVQPHSDCEVCANSVELSQVLINLLNNSVDEVSGSEGSWVKIEVLPLIDEVQIRLTDSGKRPSDDVCKKMFDPFFTTKAVGSGTGLGLSLSQGIIESYSGSLEIDMTSENTSFIISLPVHTAGDADAT